MTLSLFWFVLGCGSGGSGSNSAQNIRENCTSFISGPPVGLACIHCAHPNAQEQAMKLAQIVRDSCRSQITVNYLIDGSFGTDDDFLVRHISTLATNRRLTVIFYFSNGPAQRVWQQTKVHGFGTDISPESFRAGIMSDPTLRTSYQDLVSRAVAIRARVPASVQFIFVPGLEDNLTDAAFLSMLELTRSVGGNTVQYGRSADPGSYPNNGAGIPTDVIPELHTLHPNGNKAIITNDGITYSFPGDTPDNDVTSLQRIIALKNTANAHGDIFILWTAEFQGTGDNPFLNSAFLAPDTRNYQMPTDAQTSELINFLQ